MGRRDEVSRGTYRGTLQCHRASQAGSYRLLSSVAYGLDACLAPGSKPQERASTNTGLYAATERASSCFAYGTFDEAPFASDDIILCGSYDELVDAKVVEKR
jgi:hypothetical protein